jgi:hypothetical protein
MPVTRYCRLGVLHQLIIRLIGWTDSHMHQFFVRGTQYGNQTCELDKGLMSREDYDAARNTMICRPMLGELSSACRGRLLFGGTGRIAGCQNILARNVVEGEVRYPTLTTMTSWRTWLRSPRSVDDRKSGIRSYQTGGTRMSAEFRRKSIVAALFCISLVFAIGAWSGSGGEKKPASPYDDEEYKEILAQQVGNIYQLEAWAAAVQDDFLPILPPVPDFILKQPAGPEVLPFDAKSFPPAFVNGMAGIYENSVPVYPVLVVEDPATRALTFYNLDNEAVYTLPPPAGYDPFAFLRNRWPGLFTGGANEAARRNMMQLYDPARIQVRARLIESDNLAHWIYTKRRIEASQPSLSAGAALR